MSTASLPQHAPAAGFPKSLWHAVKCFYDRMASAPFLKDIFVTRAEFHDRFDQFIAKMESLLKESDTKSAARFEAINTKLTEIEKLCARLDERTKHL